MSEIIAKLPCFWYAQYAKNIGHINVNNNKILLTNSILHQFDENGDTTCKWDELPLKDMVLFGMINGILNELYAIEIASGDFIISSLASNATARFAPALPRIYGDKDNLIKTSHVDLDGKVDNIQYKMTCSAMQSSKKQFMEFMIGYIRNKHNKNILSAITVDTRDFKPRFGTKYLDNNKDILDPILS